MPILNTARQSNTEKNKQNTPDAMADVNRFSH